MRKSTESYSLEEFFSTMSSKGSFEMDGDDELFPVSVTFDRLRTAIVKSVVRSKDGEEKYVHKEMDVRELGDSEKQEFVRRVLRVTEKGNQRLLQKLRDRCFRAGIQFPTVEVRFDHLTVEAKCYVGNRALPTLLNSARNLAESALDILGIRLAKRTTLTILKDVSGIIHPSRMTLLLGPPSSGKTTLLLALAGRLDSTLKTVGEITYNGYRLDEFVPRKTASYISQNNVHTGEMTVKETLDFSARFQGIGARYELLNELARREEAEGIFPDPEVDLFMKATSTEGMERSLQTEYVLRILGLDCCADTVVGDEMRRGISGGEKKRLTTGEMIVGPMRTLFMDEISTGLDSSTTYQIVKCLQQSAHLGESTILMSLLQPSPETFDLFDNIILLSEGQIVYQGPREFVLEFFEACGFFCPERKGTADFLQEVTSRKDQQQYWADKNKPYHYISVSEFAKKFKKFHGGLQVENELSIPFDKNRSHRAALVFSKHAVPASKLLKTSFAREWLLIKRNFFVYIFSTIQMIIIAIIASTVFIGSKMHTDNEEDGTIYIGALLFALSVNLFNRFSELAFTITRLPVFYNHRDLLFYPAWVYTLPNFLLRVPISIFESLVWVTMTYSSIGFAPEASRFFKQLLLIFLIQQMAAALFRATAGFCRTMIISNTGGVLSLLVMFVLGGFILPRDMVPKWWIWGYWISPLTYGYNALAVNELLAERWMNKFAPDGRRLGVAVLENASVFPEKKWFWIGAVGLLGFTILFNILFTLALMFLDPFRKTQTIVPDETSMDNKDERMEPNNNSIPQALSTNNGSNTCEMRMLHMRDHAINGLTHDMYIDNARVTEFSPKRGMVLPFTPLSMSFDDVNYYVDMPAEMKHQGITENSLQLLRGVTGAFRPGVLTALMGVSGAGKTTLLDVLAGRKTGGYIEGDIRISGYPKNQAAFARISGYCEQNDIHSPQVTVRESVIYSAFLRLPKEVSDQEKMKFIDEVMELVELDNIKDAIVGLPGVTGLSTEQRKRLTIAVELVANPSIIFMDEPTSGLDARAAAIVMRTVRNTVDTGRTIVCTIHQPSIDIFESFDELLLMKTGGQVIYFGPLGRNSHKIIEYFEAIPGVTQMKEKCNPATWILEESSISTEVHLGIDFAEYYMSSELYRRSKALVAELSKPAPGTSELHFTSQYSQSTFEQFKACLWKQWWTYWRSPDYNVVRFFFTIVTALLLGTIFWRVGNKRDNANNLRIIIGSMYASVMFVGITNCATVQPVVAIERTVFYRERAAGMYSALPYAMAQVVVEIPYVLAQGLVYTVIVYSMMSFQWTAAKFAWFFFISIFSFLYFTYYGMMTVSVSLNHQIAAIIASFFYALFNLFSGFFIPKPKIPKWWTWYYWICPLSWSLYGMIVTQYGDLEDMIKVPGQPDQMIKFYVRDYYGYDTNFMGTVAAVLVGFSVFFAFMFAFCIKKLNFQQR